MDENRAERVVILGAGAFGGALAHVMTLSGAEPWVWNDPAYPGRELPEKTHRVETLEHALAMGPEVLWIIAIAAQGLGELCGRLKPLVIEHRHHGGKRPAVFIASKGIEQGTGAFAFEVVQRVLGDNVCLGALGGPNLAGEMRSGKCAGMTLACEDAHALERMARALRFMRIEKSRDVAGVQVVGALKNIYAIGSGFLGQKAYGENARATYLVEVLKEIQCIGKHYGAEEATFHGYAGLGDLILTCMSPNSRNTAFGLSFQEGNEGFPHSSGGGENLVEGYFSARAIKARFSGTEQGHVHMPIALGIADVLEKRISIEQWAFRWASPSHGAREISC